MSLPDTLSLAVLQLRLQQRRTREQLADQGIMPREYHFLPFSPTHGSGVQCSSWVLLRCCVAPAVCSDPQCSEQIAAELGFISNPVAIQGAVQWCSAFAMQDTALLFKLNLGLLLSLQHPKTELHSALSQRSLWQSKALSKGRASHILLQKSGASVEGSDPQCREKLERDARLQDVCK